MTPALIAVALWKCSAIDPASGQLYYAQAATRAQASRLAVSRCETANPFDPPTTCFEYKCWEVPQPVCNADHTVCRVEIDPNEPGAEMWMRR